MRVRVIWLILSILYIGNAFAKEEYGYFFEISLGQTAYPWNSNPTFEEQGDDNVSSWSIGSGVKINRNIYFNFSYNNLGKHQKSVRGTNPPFNSGPFAELNTDVSTIALSLSPQLDVSKNITLFGELGRHWWKQGLATRSVVYQGGIFSSFADQNLKADGNDNFWALGAKYEINSKYHLGLKYSDYKIPTSSLKNYSISASYNF